MSSSTSSTNILLSKQYLSDPSIYEIGIDEAGRGPLFGRLYVAAVILPKDIDFGHKDIKDSKKIKSKKKMSEVSEYIKQNSLAYSIQFIEHSEIDEINIRQAVFRAAHRCIKDVYDQVFKSLHIEHSQSNRTKPFISAPEGGILNENLCEKRGDSLAKFHILMDGNDFIPYTTFDKSVDRIVSIPYDTIEGGDAKLVSIAAASILAKDSRDKYIEALCIEYPVLVERYSLDKNMGYGTKKHLDGIKEFGICQFHRRTYGQCKTARINEI
jgi:ribonuclease HII